ncbi:MAG: hypothetical protein HWQ41_02495 [Nostoc sp. NOS(2021)]|uniref:hypothetical protein n=1 Tax=Nostoc sp. NOS(2021) TaxID=2815407 RepID=UPI0025D43BE7|nr:hypothetical protein [Nostoc sp. NOS(2021)]MBN3894166.1 hypothetical protein [Nostoc sp. NOS(2021)]
MIPEVTPSQWEGTCGCSGDLVSEAKQIHQAVRTRFVVSQSIWSGLYKPFQVSQANPA